MQKLIYALGALTVLLYVSVLGHIACTPAQRQELAAEGLGEVAKIGGCVLQNIIENGLSDPKEIIGKCPQATVHDIAGLTEGWLAQLTPADGGPPAQVSQSHIRLALANDRAKTAIDGGAK